MSEAKVRTRFAPSPTGYLHLGHAYSAWKAWSFAQSTGAEFVLRIEDTDISRARPEFEAAILEDLAWLGLKWEEPVRRQSDFFPEYEVAVARLTDQGLTYPCFCTRKEIREEVAAAAGAPHEPQGPDGPVYPGTCRNLTPAEQEERKGEGRDYALRLNVARAVEMLEEAGNLPLSFTSIENADETEIEVDPHLFGDIVIARKGTPTSYHFSVVLDDWKQGVTHIVRGEDLEASTHIQRVLQALWKIEPPRYLHHGLVRDKTGRRLAKRDKDTTLREMRAKGMSAEEVIELARAGVAEEG